jgi:hypothetical protein
MGQIPDGVAWIRPGGGDSREFYGVFYEGVLQPEVFATWMEAREHFVALLQQKIEAQPE